MSHTLVLNADYRPMGVLPLSALDWKDATRAHFIGTVKIHSVYENWTVRSPSHSMAVPAVIVKNEYVNVERMVAYSADMVKLRDGYRCLYCGGSFRKEKLTLDHVVPKSKGGKEVFSNIVASCGPCNSRRGNDERIQPRHPPYLPTRHELIAKRKLYPVQVPHASWIEFIDWPPHLVQIVEPKGQPGYTPIEQTEYGPDFVGDSDTELIRRLLLNEA